MLRVENPGSRSARALSASGLDTLVNIDGWYVSPDMASFFMESMGFCTGSESCNLMIAAASFDAAVWNSIKEAQERLARAKRLGLLSVLRRGGPALRSVFSENSDVAMAVEQLATGPSVACPVCVVAGASLLEAATDAILTIGGVAAIAKAVSAIIADNPHYPVPDLPKDPTQPPGEGWEWHGKPPTGGGEGAWVNPGTGEALHPDLDHPSPIGPHWDWKDPSGKPWRIFPDGRVEPRYQSLPLDGP